jgi:hypothetical protein
MSALKTATERPGTSTSGPCLSPRIQIWTLSDDLAHTPTRPGTAPDPHRTLAGPSP